MGRLGDCHLSTWWAQPVLLLHHSKDCSENMPQLHLSQDQLLQEQPCLFLQHCGLHMFEKGWGSLDDLQSGQDETLNLMSHSLHATKTPYDATNHTHQSLSVTTCHPLHCRQSQPHWVGVLWANKGKMYKSHYYWVQCIGYILCWRLST